MRQLRPDFKTIADFRKDNAAAFKAVVREFTRLCRQLGLFGGQLLAVDGTKIKASNAADRNWSQRKLAKQQAQLEAKLEEYLKALEAADTQESAVDRTAPPDSRASANAGSHRPEPALGDRSG